MPYEKYVPAKKLGGTVKSPEIKVLKGGQISLNASAYKEFCQGASHVELYFDAAHKKVGLKPKKYATKATVKLRAVGKGKSTYRIGAQQFMDHFNIRPAAKKSVKLAWNKSENMIELSL
ncbi:hypothetical protein ACFLZR_00940 [Candidatus Neomarinimicrobiota bacterium]